MPAGTKWFVLDQARDGLEQIATVLSGQVGVTALHLISHGSSGALQLGNLRLSEENVLHHTQQWAEISGALSSDADILIYGCNVAAGEVGQAFVDQIAKLTGADVAASTDLTGAIGLGGDWQLESNTGSIESAPLDFGSYDQVLALPGARSAAQGSEVFLGGNYIELGISSVGSFGTSGSKPAGFFGTTGSSAVGLSNDADGYGTGEDLRIDYFLPGSPEERWAIGYNGDTTGGYSQLAGTVGAALTATSLTNQSAGDTLKATFSGIVDGVLGVEQVISFGVNDKFFLNTVKLTNLSASTLTDVRFMRSFDPDNTKYKDGDYTTINTVRNTVSADGYAVVSASSQTGDAYYTAAGNKQATVLFFSDDARAKVAAYGFSNSDPYAMPTQAKGYSVTEDEAIAIMFEGGDLAAGDSVTFSYYTSLDSADISDTVTAIQSAGAKLIYSPTTLAESTTNAGQIAGQITIDLVSALFATALGASSTFDSTQVTVTGVPAGLTAVVTRVSSTQATLTLTGTANSHANANDVANLGVTFLDAAFAGAAAGTAAKIAGYSRSDLRIDFSESGNHAPSGMGNTTVPAVNEDTSSPAGVAISALTGLAFADTDDGNTLKAIAVVNNTANATSEGRWQYSHNGTDWSDIDVVSAGSALLLSAASKVRFVPVADYNGSPGSLTVRAIDSTANFTSFSTAGSSAVKVTINAGVNGDPTAVSAATNTISTTITAVNDAPVITSSGSTSYTENAAATAVNPTLTVADIDSTTFQTATVSISTNFQNGQDILGFSNNGTSMGDIVASYNAATGVLSMSSSSGATLAQWQAALRAVTYANSSDAPSTSARTVSFVVSDGAANSSAATRSVTVSAVNDAAAVTGLGGDTPLGITGTMILLDAGTPVSVTDPDSANFNGGNLTVTTPSGTADGDFALDGTNVKAGPNLGQAGGAITAGDKVYVGSTQIGTVHASNDGQAGHNLVITFNSSATPALVSTLLQNLGYSSKTTGIRTFQITLKDSGSGATSSAATVDLTVITPPDPEVITSVSVDGIKTSEATVTVPITIKDPVAGKSQLEFAKIATLKVPFVSATREEANKETSLADIPVAQNAAGEALIQVGLPVGVGLTSQAISSSTGERLPLREALIAASSPKIKSGDPFLKVVEKGIDAYVPVVQDQAQVAVRTLTLTAASDKAGVSEQPILIKGTTGTGESDLNHPDRQEALVIDARALPAGTTLQLENVEFAIIAGAARVVGGDGRNFVIGDDANQYIVLGADDDVLRGGAGDDVVGSKGGDDRLFGDDGNDTLFGGTGHNLMHGGKDQDRITYEGKASDYVVTRDHGKTIITSRSDPDLKDTIINAEEIEFSDRSVVIANAKELLQIATLYKQVLGRQAEIDGFQYWSALVDAGVEIGQIAIGFVRSQEKTANAGFAFDALTSGTQLDLLYQYILGRGADAEGMAYWLEKMGSGTTIEQVATAFVNSPELMGMYLKPTDWDFIV